MRTIDQLAKETIVDLVCEINLNNNSKIYDDILSDYIGHCLEVHIPYQYGYLLGLRSQSHVDVYYDHEHLYFYANIPSGRPRFRSQLFYKKWDTDPRDENIDIDCDEIFCLLPKKLFPIKEGSLEFSFVYEQTDLWERHIKAKL